MLCRAGPGVRRVPGGVVSYACATAVGHILLHHDGHARLRLAGTITVCACACACARARACACACAHLCVAMHLYAFVLKYTKPTCIQIIKDKCINIKIVSAVNNYIHTIYI